MRRRQLNGGGIRRAERFSAVHAHRRVSSQAIVAEEILTRSDGADATLYQEFSQLLDKYQFAFKVGDKITGKVFHTDAKGALVDIGAKALAMCPAVECSLATIRNVRKHFSTFVFPPLCDVSSRGFRATISVNKSPRVCVTMSHAPKQLHSCLTLALNIILITGFRCV